MQMVDLSKSGSFALEKMKKVNLWQTPRMFCDVYGLEPGQAQAGHTHAHNDKIYVVLEGAGHFQVGSDEQTLGPGHAVYVPPGAPHGVANPGPGRLRLLVFVAPAIEKG